MIRLLGEAGPSRESKKRPTDRMAMPSVESSREPMRSESEPLMGAAIQVLM